MARRPARAAAPRRGSRARRVRLALVVLAMVGCALAAAYLLWLRDSSLVRVESTSIRGLTTAQAGEIRRLLENEARSMTTLNVDEAALERAVAAYPAVAGVEATPDLPHGLAIEVIERRPIATVEGSEGGDVPVAVDGTLLPDFRPRGPLARLPAAAPQAAGRLDDEQALALLAAVEAAPPALASRIKLVERDEEGRLEALLRDGPRVLLGDDARLAAKWAAAAAALAEEDVAGSGYLDVTLPERPAAGG